MDLPVQRQVSVPVYYKGRTLGTPLRLDLLVAEKVIVECKSTTQLMDIHKSQISTYLRLTGLKLGLLINFGEQLVPKGICRIVNQL